MRLGRAIVPLLILSACVGGAVALVKLRPEPPRRPRPVAMQVVEALRVEPEDFRVVVRSQGTVEARTRSTLMAEVPGKIVEVFPGFRGGGFFEEGDPLVRIDPLDFEVGATVAAGEVAQAEAALAQEQARAAQAIEDWERLGRGAAPSDLALRKPQLAEAEAVVEAARARLRKAQADLARTTVRAPFAGRILSQEADVGQFVNTGTALATLYAIDYAEVRLPLSNQQLAFIDIPLRFRGDRPAEAGEAERPGPAVTLRGTVAGRPAEWTGRIVRTSGSIDARSRQLFAIAQVDDPYGRRQSGVPPLKVGLFVQAEVEGVLLEDVFVLPRSALQPDDSVLAIDAENRLRRRTVEVLWSEEDRVVVGRGLAAGDLVARLALDFAAEGSPVTPRLQDPPGPAGTDGDGDRPDEPGGRQPAAAAGPDKEGRTGS